MRNNTRSNNIIKWIVIVSDFVLLLAVLVGFALLHPGMDCWSWEKMRIFLLVSVIAMMASEWHFHTNIHERLVSAGDVLKTIMLLTIVQVVLSYLILRHLMYWVATGELLVEIGVVLFCLLVFVRLAERTVTLVGSDSELWRVYEQLLKDPTTGYRVEGYYSNVELKNAPVTWLGSIADLASGLNRNNDVSIGDEMYVCLSRRERQTIRRLSRLCDSTLTRFYYIPVSVESIELDLKREYVNDIEVFTTHESPLQNPVNRLVKRVFDIILSVVALAGTAMLFPLVYLIIKIQSPGPIFFSQLRTGLDGKDFRCYKFRSMHVNTDADKVQATKDDPRKYPFGNFMRKANIDELPQFWNVLKGDMSVVGPRPHMLAHTEQYSQLIDQYMVRHFVKPGVTGWAQVTGYRGETKELWQMEGRVKRDIWYMEHWSIWLDIRIVWLTFKTIFKHDQNAY